MNSRSQATRSSDQPQSDFSDIAVKDTSLKGRTTSSARSQSSESWPPPESSYGVYGPSDTALTSKMEIGGEVEQSQSIHTEETSDRAQRSHASQLKAERTQKFVWIPQRSKHGGCPPILEAEAKYEHIRFERRDVKARRQKKILRYIYTFWFTNPEFVPGRTSTPEDLEYLFGTKAWEEFGEDVKGRLIRCYYEKFYHESTLP